MSNKTILIKPAIERGIVYLTCIWNVTSIKLLNGKQKTNFSKIYIFNTLPVFLKHLELCFNIFSIIIEELTGQ